MMITAWRKSARLAARVAQPAVVEHLQEQVQDARVGLLELVEQHDRERLAADPRRPATRSSGSPSPSIRRAVPGFWYSLRSSRIIRSRRAEQVLGQRLGDLGLARAGRADEQQHGLRARRVGQPRLDQRDALDHALDRLRLADHARGEERAQRVDVEPLALVEQRQRQPGALGDRGEHVGDRQRLAGRRAARRLAAARAARPGSAPSPRKWRPSASASRSTARRSPGAARAASASVRGSSIGSTRTTSNASRTAGRARTSRS